jgi:hypothetical protein
MKTYIVLGTEAPRYCYSGNFIRGFQATSPEEALAKAKCSKGGSRYHSVVEYDSNGDIHVIYPPPREIGSDGVPF